MTHKDNGRESDPQAGHKMSDIQATRDRHAGHSVAMFRDKFWLSFILTVPVLFCSTDVQRWFGYTAPSFPGSRFIPAILGTVVFFYGGLVFIRGAWGELADRKPGMMTLISMGIIVAFGTSLAGTSGLFELEVWWELTSLITIMILGHWLQMRAVFQSRGALNALAALLRDTAERVRGADTEKVPLSELRVGDIVLVRPGARVPADGVVVEGVADVDESMCCTEDRVLMTLDLDFANVQAYPPKSHPGIVVFRPESQDKPTLVALVKRLVPVLLQLSPKHQLWIVEPDRIRYREE